MSFRLRLIVGTLVISASAYAQCPPPPEAPMAISPDGQNFPANSAISYSWAGSSASGVTGYDAIVAPAGGPASIACSSPGFSCTGAALPAGTYNWIVRAKIPGCSPGLDSTSKRFSVGCPSGGPMAQSPANGAQNIPTTVTLTWTAVADADIYDVFLGTAGGSSGCISMTPFATSTTPSFSTVLQAGTSYEWRVAAKRSGTACPPQSSTCSTFRTVGTACDPAGAFNLSSPANNASLSATPTLSWFPSAGAQKYLVHLGTTNPPPLVTDPPVLAPQLSYTPSQPLTSGTYFWYVEADPSCAGVNPTRSSSVFSFNLTVTTCPTTGATLVAPAPGSRFDTASPVAFSWTSVNNAFSYDVMLSSDGGTTFSSIATLPTGVTSTSKSLNAGSYIWFVRTNYGMGCPSVRSSAAGFSVVASAGNCPNFPPVLVAPANGATDVPSPVRFDWNPVPNATSYRLMAIFGTGSPTVVTITGETEFTIEVPAGSVEWWAEVLATNCPTLGPPHFRFTAVGTSSCPQSPGVATLVSPIGGASLNSPITFTWSAVAGATLYRVWAAIGSSVVPVVLGTSPTTTFTAQLPQGNVIWFVEARFDPCPSTFSARASFNVASPTVCNNSPTTLVSPANNATNVTSPVTFRWDAKAGAIGYKLFVGANGAAPDLVGVTTDTSLTRLVPQGTITWWVDTAFPGCRDEHSAEFHFTVGAVTSCGGSITLNAPANGATVGPQVLFVWSAVPGATAYRLWASVDGGPAVNLTRTTSTTVTLPLASGSIEWQVEALFDACPSVLSPRGRFTVTSASNCSVHRPVSLVSPVGGAQVSNPVDFTWSATDTTVTLYRVWVSIGNEPFVDVGVTRETHLRRDIPPGSGQWFVESFFEGCPPLASARANLSIAQPPRCVNDAPLLINPVDAASNVTAPVTLLWTNVPNATAYRVFASANGSDPVVIARTTSTSVTRPLVPGSIVWWVQAEFDGCPVTTSTRSRFTIPRAANCATSAPELIAPANGTNNAASPVTLDWNPVSTAVGYAVFVRHNNGAPTRIGETRDTEVIRRLPEGTIEWWVIAFFAGCPAQESPHNTFAIPPTICDNRSPVLMSPADGASSLTSPIRLAWSGVPRAKSYKVWASIDDGGSSVLAATTANSLTVVLPAGTVEWFVEALFDSCPTVASATSSFITRSSAPSCETPDRPGARVAGQVASGTPFTIHWSAVANAANYELVESTNPNFTGATTQVINDVSATLTRTTGNQPTRYFYRIRAISSCSEDRGPYSKVASVVVVPETANPQRQTTIDVAAQAAVTQQLVLPSQDPPVSFSVRADKPWITVSPSSGTLGPAGVTLTVTYDPAALKLGTNTGTILLTFGSSGGNRLPNGVAPVIPVSIGLVTPVAPSGKNTPPPDSLIIPAVGHAPGLNNSLFESDVRVANTSAQTMKYQLNFTLSGTDGTQSGQSSTISIEPGATMALDDILTNFFGIGSDGGAATGVLEIRPLTSSTSSGGSTPSIQTVASSRTFNATPNGTFGQFIPAIPFSQFIGGPADGTPKSILSLQQIAQSAAYRTNFGLVEAAGEPANVLVHVLNSSGAEIAPISVSLLPGEHKQINSFLPNNGIATLQDGRLEVEVTSATGKVTAYASVVDNVTNDPLLVFPVQKGSVSASRYVLPGVGDFDIGFAHWKSDVRIYNSAQTSVPVTLTYNYHDAAGAPAQVSTTMTLQGGEVRALDNLIVSVFPTLPPQTAGSLVVSTASSSALVATARTYTQTTSGTYGQFIPAATPADAVGSGERSLQLLQLEASERFRTNIGLAETSGSAATAHVSLILPDSKFAISTDIPLAANEFRQISLGSFGAGTVYNGRVTVSVTNGTGRVTAYASVIDQLTQDPTYVPAQ